MSTYYKFKFTSPEPSFAIVKEELKSYFDSGAVDDLMFPTYLNRCLEMLGLGSYSILETILYIEGYESRLPDNFRSVREAWLCTDINGFPYRTPSSFYSQAVSQDTIQISPVTVGGKTCQNNMCDNPKCNGTECMPEIIQAVYKTNFEVPISYRKAYLLKPSAHASREYCSSDCWNFGSQAPDTFDIRDNKLSVNFSCGTVYMVYYATEYDNNSNQLIPDNVRIKKYIESYLKYKMIENMFNQSSDESFNQLSSKLSLYKQEADESYIIALNEMRRETMGQKQRRIVQEKNRFNKYELPSGRWWVGRRHF